MADSNVRVARLQGHYGRLVDRYLERLERAAQDSSDGLYSPTRWLSDAYASWSDLMSAAVFPLEFVTPLKMDEKRPLREVEIVVEKGTDEAVEAAVVPDPGATQLVVSDLTRATASDRLVAGTNVDVSLCGQGRVLVVRLRALKSLPAGEYTGTVATPKNPAPFATIRVRIADPGAKGP